ncbi:MAG: trypsin-like peptidase domain-containing protein, partial [Treponema sp.]|nr:trypsin-like peptidase domain-containing protein [Treponema sp.]
MMTRFFILALSLVLLFSCTSTSAPPEVYKAVNYTEEDAVNDEIINVRSLIKTEPVCALWRASLIMKNAPSVVEAAKLFSECEQQVYLLYEDAYKAGDYLLSFRFLKSIEAVSSNKTRADGVSSEKVFSLLKKSVPGFTSVLQAEKKVSDFINGTVTVYVDKGIKIERGLGYTDAVLGSGFFISKDGYIVTNHHVISDCVDPEYEGFSRLYIKLAEDPDTRIPAKVIGYDSSLDIALIKAEVEAPYVFTLGSSSDLETGTEVYAIGSPLGLEKTITRGIISSTDRRLMLSAKVFQLDAAVNSGNSGGPLIDGAGRVQAIVFA